MTGLTTKSTNRILSPHLSRIGKSVPFLTQKPLTQLRIGSRSIAQITGFEGPTFIEGLVSFSTNPYGFLPDLVSRGTDSELLDQFVENDPFFEFNPFTGELDPGTIPLGLGVDPNLAYQYVPNINQEEPGSIYSGGGGFRAFYYPSSYYSYEEYLEASEECQCSPA